MTDSEILEARDKAWERFIDFDAQELQPRYYKKKKGNKSEWINPFRSNEEREELLAELRRLREEWFQLTVECVRRGLPNIPQELVHKWIVVDTYDGKRMVRNEHR